MAPITQYWGKPTSTLDWCEINYEVSPFIAEFWNTVSNLGMIVPPILGIHEVLRLGLEKKFILTHLFLIVVGLGSWAFHMTLLWPMQLADELPMVWGNSILIYQLCEIRKSSKRQINWLIIVLCFTYCFFFTSIYLIFKIPWIHHGMYGILVFVVVYLDLQLVKANQCRTCTKLLSTGFFMYTLGFGLWNIDNQMCSQLSELRRILPGSLRPWTQLHALWHLLAGCATYLHILFGKIREGMSNDLRPVTQMHAWWHIFAGLAAYGNILFLLHIRSHFRGPKVGIKLYWYGFGVYLEKPDKPTKAILTKSPSEMKNGFVKSTTNLLTSAKNIGKKRE